MDIDACIEQYLSEDPASQAFERPLPDAAASRVVDRLKQEADRNWFIDPHRSLTLANRIVAIGQRRQDVRQTALGLMARGNALMFLGQTAEAWNALEEAGKVFRTAADEVGWASTRISRLYLSVKLNCVPTALAEAEQARAIFTHGNDRDRLLRLDLNTALVYAYLGDYHRALTSYDSALQLAGTLGEAGQHYLGPLYTNIGIAYDTLGDFDQALTYYERARSLMVERAETRNVAAVEINIAYIARCQGRYRHAMRLLHGVLEHIGDQFPLEALLAKENMVGCYVFLNRYVEARDLARSVIADHRSLGDSYELSRTLLHLATAEAKLANFAASNEALTEAETIFAALGATPLVATTHLWRGEVALHEGNLAAAYREAETAAASFEAGGQQVDYAAATLLQGRVLFALREYSKSKDAGAAALKIAQRNNVPWLRYSAHYLLGQIAETQRIAAQAVRRYQAAAATVDRVQRGLTITLRPGFLEDKGDALRALIALRLRFGEADNAFDTLEHAKSQVLLNYLANREQFHWAQDDSHSRALIAELSRLRVEHQWFYSLAHDVPQNIQRPHAISPDQALTQLAIRERRMRAITEQLYLHSSTDEPVPHAPATSLREVQAKLEEGELLIEFYCDGRSWWAFTVEAGNIAAHPLPIAVEGFNQLLAQLRVNLAAALNIEPRTASSARFTRLTQRLLQRLHEGLLAPLRLQQHSPNRLIIVPYGALHYLPFHLLYDGTAYLTERLETIVLPAAGLIAQPKPERERGALVIVHSHAGQLPHTGAEAQMVCGFFGGTLRDGDTATRDAFQTPPTQILHIAAHGQHRPDQPDLSYLQLADGQLFADDLLQHDLSYELVTLSACETGQANVSGGDELIGLGRGFLYAGAGALLASLWPVADLITVELMEHFYRALAGGASKAAALRNAQQTLLSTNAWLHPAYWGAFQLIGNPDPLSAQGQRIHSFSEEGQGRANVPAYTHSESQNPNSFSKEG